MLRPCWWDLLRLLLWRWWRQLLHMLQMLQRRWLQMLQRRRRLLLILLLLDMRPRLLNMRLLLLPLRRRRPRQLQLQQLLVLLRCQMLRAVGLAIAARGRPLCRGRPSWCAEQPAPPRRLQHGRRSPASRHQRL
jgi:hypothetical protein